MAKYDPLFEFLFRAGDRPVSMTFDEIERIVGALPASASKFRPWWANERPGGRHVQAAAWLNAGREVAHVDLRGRVVRFSEGGLVPSQHIRIEIDTVRPTDGPGDAIDRDRAALSSTDVECKRRGLA